MAMETRRRAVERSRPSVGFLPPLSSGTMIQFTGTWRWRDRDPWKVRNDGGTTWATLTDPLATLPSFTLLPA